MLEDRYLLSTATNLNDAGPGSLREAIALTPAGGTVDFQPGLSGTITLTTGELAINKDMTIVGPGAGVITVSGNNASRVFMIEPVVNVSLSGLTIAGGRAPNGGGISNAGGMLTVMPAPSPATRPPVSSASAADKAAASTPPAAR